MDNANKRSHVPHSCPRMGLVCQCNDMVFTMFQDLQPVGWGMLYMLHFHAQIKAHGRSVVLLLVVLNGFYTLNKMKGPPVCHCC